MMRMERKRKSSSGYSCCSKALLVGWIGIFVTLRVLHDASTCRKSLGMSKFQDDDDDFESNDFGRPSSITQQARPLKVFNITNPVTGFFPGWNEGVPINRSTLTTTTKEFVPKRLIAVFGLESSGTTFVQKTLATALKATGKYEVEYHTVDREIRIQHFSLPTGTYRKDSPNKDRQFETLPIIPVHVPYQCHQSVKSPAAVTGAKTPSPLKCHELFGPYKVTAVLERYFINITSHVEFYQRRGIDTTAVLVVRDPALHFRGIIKTHCPNQTAAFEQYQTGRALLREAMELLDPQSYVIVSYETLMTLQDVYWKQIYKALRINSDYTPAMKNGNLAYAPQSLVSSLLPKRLAEDKGKVDPNKLSKNLYEPKSYNEIRAKLESQ